MAPKTKQPFESMDSKGCTRFRHPLPLADSTGA